MRMHGAGITQSSQPKKKEKKNYAGSEALPPSIEERKIPRA